VALANQTATVAWGYVTATAVAPTVWAQSTNLAIGATATEQYLQLQRDAATSTAIVGNAFVTSTASANQTATAGANMALTATAIPQATLQARQETLNEARFQCEQMMATLTPWLPWALTALITTLLVIAFFMLLPRARGLLEAKELRLRTFRGPVTHVASGHEPVNLASSDRMAQPVLYMRGTEVIAAGGLQDETAQAQIAALAALASAIARLQTLPPSLRRDIYTQLAVQARTAGGQLLGPQQLPGLRAPLALIASPVNGGPLLDNGPVGPIDVPATGVINHWLDEAEEKLGAGSED
jgi:hypothetical protein